jgi:hypothetical protein
MEILIILAILLAVLVYMYEDDAPVKGKPIHKVNNNPQPYQETHIIPDTLLRLEIETRLTQLPKQAHNWKPIFYIDDEVLETQKQTELERMYRHHRVKSHLHSYSIMFDPI